MRLAILMTCHNRVSLTLECLKRVFDSSIPNGWGWDIWLVDDGSTDGTAASVESYFARQKQNGWSGNGFVIPGHGDLYWCGGMRLAWKCAGDYFSYDGYLWLNDDTWLDPDGIATMLSQPETFTVGAISSRDRKHVTYGGIDRFGKVLSPSGKRLEVFSCHGNCVFVPKSVYSSVGNFSYRWTHAMGDGDYCRTVYEMDLHPEMTEKYVGTCDRNVKPPEWMRRDVPLGKRLRNLYSPLGYGEPPKLFYYCWKHDGVAVAIKNFLSQHIHVLFPHLWEGRSICEGADK